MFPTAVVNGDLDDHIIDGEYMTALQLAPRILINIPTWSFRNVRHNGIEVLFCPSGSF